MKNPWGIVFAGISAIAGILYILHSRQQNIAPVTNIFPPLNTPDSTTSDAETNEPLATQSTSPIGIQQATSTTQVYAVQSV
jgi:hypothetical protein